MTHILFFIVVGLVSATVGRDVTPTVDVFTVDIFLQLEKSVASDVMCIALPVSMTRQA